MHRDSCEPGRLIAAFGAAPVLLLCLLAGPSRAANAISKAVERAQPCGSLKATKLGVTIGINEFKSAELESLRVNVAGDDAEVELVASLACKTSDEATFPGDAWAKFKGEAKLNLASCAVAKVAVRIQTTGGTYGFAVDAFKGSIQSAVEKSISDQVKSLCK